MISNQKLTHFVTLVFFYTSRKHQKTRGFLMFSWFIEREWWHEMSWERSLSQQQNKICTKVEQKSYLECLKSVNISNKMVVVFNFNSNEDSNNLTCDTWVIYKLFKDFQTQQNLAQLSFLIFQISIICIICKLKLMRFLTLLGVDKHSVRLYLH